MKLLLLNKIKTVPMHLWFLMAIICLGIFLRTYNLHKWLEFRGDQVRDSYLIEKVLSGESSWPLLGPYMYNSGSSKEMFYHLGPIYYYFQIIAGKIFGGFPDKFAYPDVFFSILSIPLFYLFLRIYFKKNISLGLVALYSISSYFIHYSRFAWNSNLIPFFVLLFLVSIYKILKDDEKTDWCWVVALGFALGVGLQLHAITMILFSVVTFLGFLFSMKVNYRSWKKWLVVVFMVIVLNGGQIISEINTNLGNTKRLFNFSSQGGQTNKSESKFTLLKNDISCHIEASTFFLSSYGSNNCSYGISNFLPILKSDQGFSRIIKNGCYWIVFLISFAFSFAGYFLLIKHAIKDKEKSKAVFLRMIILYAGIAFLIMIPLSVEKFSDLRYLMPVFFVPFVLLGLIADAVSGRFSKKFALLIISVFLILAFSNIVDIFSNASVFIKKDKTCSSHFTTLGEIESVADYIASKSNENGNVYIGGNKELSVVVEPLTYLLKKHNLNPVILNGENGIDSTGGSAFLISCKSKMKDSYSYQKIDNIYVFDLLSKS